MPEFDEETYTKKNQGNESLKYEPGENADRYQSKKPGSHRAENGKTETSSLWVEAATAKPRKEESRASKPNRNRSKGKNPNAKNNQQNRNRKRPNRNRRPKLTLWERILKWFGIKPKPKKRRNNRRGGGKGPNARDRKPDDREKRSRGNQDKKGPSGKRSQNQKGRSGKGDRDPNKPNAKRSSDRQEGGGNPNQKPRSQQNRSKNRFQSDTKGPRSGRAENRPQRGSEEGDSRQPRSSGPRQSGGSRQGGQQKSESTPREPRKETVESVAAPKTNVSGIALGAIELNPSDSPSKEQAAKPKTAAPSSGTGRGGRRNRRATGNNAATDSKASSDFVPHPIEVPKKSGDSE